MGMNGKEKRSLPQKQASTIKEKNMENKPFVVTLTLTIRADSKDEARLAFVQKIRNKEYDAENLEAEEVSEEDA